MEFTEGLTIDRGYISPYFVKDQERQVAELNTPRVLVTDAKVDNVNELVPLLEQLVKTKEPVLVIAEDVTGDALSALVVNKMRGVLDVAAIRAPGFGQRRKAYLQVRVRARRGGSREGFDLLTHASLCHTSSRTSPSPQVPHMSPRRWESPSTP